MPAEIGGTHNDQAEVSQGVEDSEQDCLWIR
jgi:hypothetical protein